MIDEDASEQSTNNGMNSLLLVQLKLVFMIINIGRPAMMRQDTRLASKKSQLMQYYTIMI